MKNVPYTSLILAVCFSLLPAADVASQKAFKMSGFSTTVTGTIYLARDYKPLTFSRLLIFTGAHNVDINRLVIDEFGKIGIAAFNGVGHFPPVRDYSEEELNSFCQEREIDGIIHTWIKDRWVTNEGSLTSEVELSLVDLRTNATVATVFAYIRTSYDDPEKGMATFFKAFVREFDLILEGELESDN